MTISNCLLLAREEQVMRRAIEIHIKKRKVRGRDLIMTLMANKKFKLQRTRIKYHKNEMKIST